MHTAWAEESPSASAADDDSATTSETGEMKETGGFVNMKPQTDYDAPVPEPERTPAGDSDADNNSAGEGN